MSSYILEDNDERRELELYTLKNAGYEAEAFTSSADFMAAVGKSLPELVILDIMLPDMSGLEVLNMLRAKGETKDIPVIMVTAKSTEHDKLKGFNYGADDYISKPFSLMEFTARVKAVLRRSIKSDDPELSAGNIRINMDKREVYIDNQVCELTYKEFELLRLLLKHPGHVFSRDALMDSVWGLEYIGESRTVDMHITSLRRKLGESGAMIKTVRNVGYKLSL